MKQPLIYRHGDVLLIEVDTIPQNTTVKENNMLAAGKGANHGHFLIGCKILEKNKELYINTEDTDAVLKHLLINSVKDGSNIWTKEHKDITLPKNKKFKVIRQIEYDPYQNVVKQIQD